MKVKISVYCICTVILFVFYADALSQLPERVTKPRVIVLTDISSLTQKEGEPDDGQSMIRLMFYANELDIEGLIATSNLGHGQRVHPELIKQVVEKYGDVRAKLLLHDSRYPPAAELSKIIYPGQPIASPTVPVFKSIGEGMDTQGSEHIIRAIDKNDTRPVWILIWGGSADLAQALWKVRKTRSEKGVRKFISKIRVHSIGHQDATGPWIIKEFPELFYILRGDAIRGMYRGGDTALSGSQWVRNNIWEHGSLGDLYVDYDGGDIWSYKTGPVRGIKEGDSPSFLGFIFNGLNNYNEPSWGGWGGRFKKAETSSNWIDATDVFGNYQADLDEQMATVYRWRNAWQADFANRLNWCIKSFEDANHAPVFDKSPVYINAVSQTDVHLNIGELTDPDDDKFSFNWFFYPDVTSFAGKLPIIISSGKSAAFTTPAVDHTQTIHVILEISDDGTPAFIQYKRFIVTIQPKVSKE